MNTHRAPQPRPARDRTWALHVATFLAGNLGMLLLWAADAGFPLGWDPAPYWPLWVHVTWGIGLAAHGRASRQLKAARAG